MAKEFNIKTPKAYDSNNCCGIGFVPYPEVFDQEYDPMFGGQQTFESDTDVYEELRIEQQGGII